MFCNVDVVRLADISGMLNALTFDTFSAVVPKLANTHTASTIRTLAVSPRDSCIDVVPRPAPLDRDTVCIFLVMTRLSRWVDRDALLHAQEAPTTCMVTSRARLRFSRAPPNQQQLTHRDLVSSW